MSRRKIFMILFCSIMALLIIAVGLANYNKVYREEVAAIDNIFLGMTPSEVENILGKPYQTKKHTTEVSGATYLYQRFQIDYFDNEATFVATYITIRNGFYLQSCRIECANVENTNTFCAIVHDAMMLKLTGTDGLCERVTDSGFELDINRGPVGTYYQVSVSDQTITITCESNEFYR